MRLAVNPNRMELLKLRRRLTLAERGHKLLKDKLEETMRQFLEALGRLAKLQSAVGPKFSKVTLAFALARARRGGESWDKLLPAGMLRSEARREHLLNLVLPRFVLSAFEVADYDLLNTDAELDVGLRTLRTILPDLLEMARLWKAVALLAAEIEVTRRRVNALEHILIPNIQETVAYISGRLEEIERSYQVQLLRIKDVVRHH